MKTIVMEREQEEMQFLGVFGIYKEAYKIIFSWRKIFSQITLALILPLSLISLAHIEVSNVLSGKIINNQVELLGTEAGTKRYNKISDHISSELAYFWLFEVSFLILTFIFSLLSTAAVVYTIASIYTDREVSFKKVMSVVPKVWKRLMVTSLSIFVAFFAYSVVAILVSSLVLIIASFVFIGFPYLKVFYSLGIVLLVLYIMGVVYMTIVWQLARPVSVLEEACGFKAMTKSRALIKGKMWTAIIIFFIEELSIYFLFFDRAGYGESDPYPSRSVKSEAYDIQELADQLQIGSKFYVIGMSMGAYPVYGCLKYIPHRLSGASLVVPFVHYWWPSLPANISREGFQTLCTADQRTFQVAHHTPWLFYWWMTQKWFPSLSIMAGNMNLFSPPDMEIIKKLSETPKVGQEKVRQQGVHESLHRDILAGYAKWEFDIMDISNPFPDNEGSVHLWQGYEDRIIPLQINRYIAEKLPWIHYHEVPDAGHLMLFKTELCEAILRALLLG